MEELRTVRYIGNVHLYTMIIIKDLRIKETSLIRTLNLVLFSLYTLKILWRVEFLRCIKRIVLNYWLIFPLEDNTSLSLSLSHTHTHTHKLSQTPTPQSVTDDSGGVSVDKDEAIETVIGESRDHILDGQTTRVSTCTCMHSHMTIM